MRHGRMGVVEPSDILDLKQNEAAVRGLTAIFELSYV